MTGWSRILLYFVCYNKRTFLRQIKGAESRFYRFPRHIFLKFYLLFNRSLNSYKTVICNIFPDIWKYTFLLSLSLRAYDKSLLP